MDRSNWSILGCKETNWLWLQNRSHIWW